MKILRYVNWLLTGKIKHWNNAHNVALSRLWAESENLHAPFDFILKEFISSSAYILEALMGPEKSDEVSSTFEIKSFDKSKYLEFYTILLSNHMFLFCRELRLQEEGIIQIVCNLTNEDALVREMFSLFKEQEKAVSTKEERISYSQCAWNKFTENLNNQETSSAFDFYYFMLAFNDTHRTAMDKLIRELATRN